MPIHLTNWPIFKEIKGDMQWLSKINEQLLFLNGKEWKSELVWLWSGLENWLKKWKSVVVDYLKFQPPTLSGTGSTSCWRHIRRCFHQRRKPPAVLFPVRAESLGWRVLLPTPVSIWFGITDHTMTGQNPLIGVRWFYHVSDMSKACYQLNVRQPGAADNHQIDDNISYSSPQNPAKLCLRLWWCCLNVNRSVIIAAHSAWGSCT